MHVVVDAQFTEVPFALPNFTFVAVVPGPKPLPFRITLVPPVVGPELGLTFMTTGRNLKRSADEVALVPLTVVTVTSTVPGEPAGEIAVSS